ncbi:MAG: hypothetical protein IJ379_00825 [Lachnospiraceae bacterium]|nr:hypothetical protein [Lachnospiraceae bacterium]
MNVLRVIKINVLALVAFPLLILATVVKLVAKSMEKLITIIGTVLVISMIALVFELAKNPGEFFQGLLMFIVIIVLGGLISLLIIWILTLISNVIMGIVALIINVVNMFYELVYAGYARLYHICYEDYCRLEMSNGAKRGSCFIYTLLRVFNRAIIFFATHAIHVLMVVSIGIVLWALIKANATIQTTFGLGIFSYLKLFSVYEIVYGVVLFVAVLAGIVILLMSLGVEWSEWGTEMSLSTSDYERYIRSVRSDYTAMNRERLSGTDEADRRRMERCGQSMEVLNRHMETFEAFLQETQSIAEKSEDHILRANHGQYITDLHEVTTCLNGFGGQVPLDEFEKLIPRIEQIDITKKKIEQQVRQIRETKEKKEVISGFFIGCDNEEKLDKRYKALCKTYHPDAEAGDEETFKVIHDEYERKKKEFDS